MANPTQDVFYTPVGTTGYFGRTGSPVPTPPSPPPPPPPPSPSITLSSTGSATAGTAYPVTVTAANLGGPLTVTPERVSGPSVTFEPTTVLPAPGELVKLFNLTAAAAGTLQLRATAPGGIVSNTLSVTVAAAPTPTPPPPPAPSPSVAPSVSGSAGASLSSATGATNEPVTFGLALAEGAFPQASGITVSGLSAHQVEIRNRWPDNSAKIVVVSGRCTIPAGGSITASLSRGTASTGTALTEAQLLASGVDATLQFAAGPVMTLSALIGVAAVSDATGLVTAGRVRQLASGPQMSSWLYAARLSTTNAHLIGWMEVRFYGSGRVHVLPWVENGFTRISGCAGQVGTLTFTMGGTTRFSADEVHLANHCRVYAQSTGLGHWSGTAPDVYAAPDPVYLQSTGLVPPHFLRDTASATARLNGLAQSYSPEAYGQLMNSPRNSGGNGTSNGDFDPGMSDAGYHAGIGPLPEWDVFYLTSKADRRAWNAVVSNAMGYGRYGVHWRDELTLAPVNPSDVPNKTLSQTSAPLYGSTSSRNVYGISDVGANQFGSAETLPAAAGYVMGDGRSLLPESWAMTHHPSGGFLAYLLTGHEAFAELGQMVAATCFLRQNNLMREYGLGIQHTWRETVRGQAWAIRSIMQAATISRDGSSLQSGWATIAANNINAYHAAYIASPCAALGIPRPYSNAFNPGNAPYRVNAWELDFSVSAWGYGLAMKPPVGSTALANMGAYFQWHAQWVVGRLGPLGDANSYGFNCAARNNSFAIVNSATDAPWVGNVGPFITSWGEHFSLTYGASNATNTTNTIGAFDSNNGSFPDATSYWGNLQMGLAWAVHHNVSGARDGYLRMVNASNWPEFDASAATNPVGSQRASNSPPAWSQAVQANTFNYLPGGSFFSWASANISGSFRGTDPLGSIVDAFGEPAYDPGSKTWYFHNGGHGDGSYNGVVGHNSFDLSYRVAADATPPSVYLPAYMGGDPNALIYYPSGVQFAGAPIPAYIGMWFLTQAEGLNAVTDAGYIAPKLARAATHMYQAAAYRKGSVHYFYGPYGRVDLSTGLWAGRGLDFGAQLVSFRPQYNNLPFQQGTCVHYDEATDKFFVSLVPGDNGGGWRSGLMVIDGQTLTINAILESNAGNFGLFLLANNCVAVGRKLYWFLSTNEAQLTQNAGVIVDMDEAAAKTGLQAMSTSYCQRFVLTGDTAGSTWSSPVNQEVIPAYHDGVAIRRWNYDSAHRQYIYSVNTTPVSGAGTPASPFVLQQTRITLSGTPPASPVKFVYSRLRYIPEANAAVCLPAARQSWFAIRLT